ncbi:histidine kinase, partial [Mycobacteroides chelonae]|uniref:histidine kinase n=1 Tax=Mycobacteroides chelonae TaxID=1774 RepID=UPI0009929138
GRVLGGVSLRAELDRSGTLTAARAVALVAQVAVDLDGLAADGGLRSDIVDPANILLALDGSVSLSGPATAVESGVAYLAPERLARTAPVSAATDVYSLACVLSECLTGRLPHVDGRASVGENSASVLAHFDTVLARGLAGNPGDRFPSAGAFAVAARKALREGESDGAASTSGPSPVRQKQSQAPVLSSHVRDVLSNPNIRLPSATGYRSVTEKVRPVSSGPRLRQAATVAAVLLLIGVSIVAVRNVVGVDGTATGPQSKDVHLNVHPDKIAVDKAGDIYIAGEKGDYSEYGVWKLAPGWNEGTKLPFPDDGMRAMGVTVDAAGRIYVTTFRGNVLVLTPDTGEVRKYPIDDQGDLGDIAVDSAGNVVGAGSRSDAGRTSSWIWTLNTATGAVTRLPFPESGAKYQVAVGPSGEIYAASSCNDVSVNWVWKLEAGAAEPAKIPDMPRCPGLLAVDPAGDLYVGDQGYPNTLMMVPAGWAHGYTLPMRHRSHTYDLAVDHAGNVYGVSVDPYSQFTLETLTLVP